MSTSTLADALTERLRQALPANQAYAPADWNVDAMPSPVRHYLRHLLRHHRDREARRLRRARTNWVHYDHPEMEQATHAFLDAVEDHLQVPREEWTDTLQTAVRRTSDYLVRPVPTLRAFVFEDPPEPVPVSKIQWRMRFFEPYAYLRNAVEAYAEKRDQDAFEPDGFERLLRRVDERMTDDFDTERWLRLLDPLFETAQRATDRKALPLPLLRTFFEEKNASRIADRLTAREHEQEAEAIDPDALRRLLDTAPTTPPSDSTTASSAPEESSLPSDIPDPADAERPPSDDPSEEQTDGATPMWKQFEQGRSRRGTEVQDESNDGSQPLWTQFQSQPSSSGPAPDSAASAPSAQSGNGSASRDPDSSLSALENEVFGTKHPPNRSVYVRELFEGDGDAYRQILKRLRATESWSTASQMIASDVFRANEVNIYSDAAVHFTNAVEAGFKQE